MTHTTLCRWCGGEMRLSSAFVFSHMVVWKCQKCGCTSGNFNNKAAALKWATQPIPFLPEEIITVDSENPYRDGYNKVINRIIATLAVREEEQK